MDYTPLFISIKTAGVATIISLILGILFAWNIIKIKSYLKNMFDCILTLPMVMPPTVLGYFLLKIFGVNGFIGEFFLEFFDKRIVFSWEATVISAVVVSLPLMYRTLRSTFEQLNKNLIYSAKTLGITNTKIFFRIVIPNSFGGLISGIILSFARALGEFGATMMLAGNIPGKTQTISTAVYSAMSAGNEDLAYKWVAVNLIISFTVIFMMNFILYKQNQNRQVI
jgi:molybdate transport system permease protein